jgi:hypothetical protein
MFTITNSNTGQTTTCKTEGQVKRILRNIVKNYGGRAALKGIYISHPKSGEWYATHLEL